MPVTEDNPGRATGVYGVRPGIVKLSSGSGQTPGKAAFTRKELAEAWEISE
jgi:hypothetical protein